MAFFKFWKKCLSKNASFSFARYELSEKMLSACHLLKNNIDNPKAMISKEIVSPVFMKYMYPDYLFYSELRGARELGRYLICRSVSTSEA